MDEVREGGDNLGVDFCLGLSSFYLSVELHLTFVRFLRLLGGFFFFGCSASLSSLQASHFRWEREMAFYLGSWCLDLLRFNFPAWLLAHISSRYDSYICLNGYLCQNAAYIHS